MIRRKPFLVGLFSVLAFTSVLAVVTEALATHICRTCRHGTVSGTGSTYSASIKITDDSLSLQETPGAAGFFDAKASTPPGQFIQCTFNDGISGETDALCAYPEFEEDGQVKAGITCSRFEQGGCAQQGQKPGTRTSIMSCKTVGAGCTGKIQIFALDGKTPLTAPIEIGKDLELIVGTNQCDNEFPTTPGQDGLRKTEMGKILQTSCTSKLDPWDANEPVSQMVVRTDLTDLSENGVPKYHSVTAAVLGVDAQCSPDDGFPAISCTNNAIVRSTFPASSAACSTENLRCGQTSNLQGPRPSECTFDSLSNLCTCTCPKCDPTTGESLADVDVPPSPGVQGSGNYVVWNQTSAAMCTVKIGGN